MKIKFSKIYTLSNFISFVRILLAIPIFLLLNEIEVIEGARYYLVSLYLFAYITDLADGFFARKFNDVSELGKIIDPLADKILVFLIVLYLYYFNMISGFYFWVIILRDIIIFSGGIFVSKKIGKVLPSNYLGKGTVLSIGIFIIIVTLGTSNENIIYNLFYFGSLILSLSSVISYGIRGFSEMQKVKNETV